MSQDRGWGAGALIGALVYGAVAHRLPRRKTFGLAFVVCGVLLTVTLWVPPLALGVAAMVASAVAFGPVNPLRLTMQQERTPVALRSRVFGTFSAVAFLATPLSTLVFTNLVATCGVIVTIAVMDGLFLCMGLATWILPAFCLMDVEDASRASRAMASAECRGMGRE